MGWRLECDLTMSNSMLTLSCYRSDLCLESFLLRGRKLFGPRVENDKGGDEI